MIRSCIALFLLINSLYVVVPETVQAEYKGTLSGDEFVQMITTETARVIVVNFWATWCGACRQEFPELIALRKQYSTSDLLLVGISLDSSEKMARFFTNRVGFNYPIYLDTGEIASAFNVTAIPRLLIFANGKIQDSHVGYTSGSQLKQQIDDLLHDAAKKKEPAQQKTK